MSISAENTFFCHCFNLFISWLTTKFGEGGWYAYGVTPVFPGVDGCESGSVCKIRITGWGNINSENFLAKLRKSSRICLVYVSCPASPDGSKACPVSYTNIPPSSCSILCVAKSDTLPAPVSPLWERLPAHIRVALAS